MGFMPDIRRIMDMLPAPAHRQTLLFSATMPRDVEQLAHKAMRPENFVYVDTVGKEENTHEHVPQQFTICPFGEEAAVLLKNLQAETANPAFKGIVFFVTARLTQYYAELFNKMGLDVLEIHSRKSQSQREKVAKEFRGRNRCFLFTSDVSARGMDYPDVTGVFQVGAPSETAQYVHRLGRTARAGAYRHLCTRSGLSRCSSLSYVARCFALEGSLDISDTRKLFQVLVVTACSFWESTRISSCEKCEISPSKKSSTFEMRPLSRRLRMGFRGLTRTRLCLLHIKHGLGTTMDRSANCGGQRRTWSPMLTSGPQCRDAPNLQRSRLRPSARWA
jgi:hypothetical protein